MRFAKIYNTQQYGQVLVYHNDSEVNLCFYDQGFCQLTTSTGDENEAVFDLMTEDMAVGLITDMIEENV